MIILFSFFHFLLIDNYFRTCNFEQKIVVNSIQCFTHMKINIPKLLSQVLITEEVQLAIDVSIALSKKNRYFPIIEPPRITRPDADTEATQINNSIARFNKLTNIIYGSLKEEEISLLNEHFHSGPINNIRIIDDLGIKVSKRYNSLEELKWSEINVGVGLLNALKTQKKLIICNKKEKTENIFHGDSRILIVAEDRKDITSVIIGNYAYALGASLLMIDEINKNLSREINDQFFKIYDENYSPSDELNAIKDKISDLLPTIDVDNYFCITFFTSGIPYGFAIQELPSSHIYIYPFLGLNICNYISHEFNSNGIVKVGLTIDPGEFDESEVPMVENNLSKRNVLIRSVKAREATANNAFLFTAAYPYDFLIISSHSNEVPGRRITYRYLDAESIERTLVVDEGVGLAWDSNINKFHATIYYRFVSLDGINWLDSEAKKKLHIGSAILDFHNLSKRDDLKNYEINSEIIDKVHSAMAYKMTDHVFMPMVQSIADENCPIVISNACSSWRTVSFYFMVAGVRAYVGPIVDVTNVEAIEFIRVLFSKHLDRPLCFALWRTQKEIYGDQIRKPYLVAGTHFTKFNFPKSVPTGYLADRLRKSYSIRLHNAKFAPSKATKDYSNRFANFLNDEIKIFVNRK